MDGNSDFIKEKLISILDIRGKSALILSNFTAAIADIFTVFRGDNAKQIGADLVAIFANSSLSILELGSKLGRDLISAIAKPITDNKELIKTALENSLGIVEELVGGIKDFIANTFESIHEAYDEASTKKFSRALVQCSISMETYNKYFAPVMET